MDAAGTPERLSLRLPATPLAQGVQVMIEAALAGLGTGVRMRDITLQRLLPDEEAHVTETS